jgi:hypothetical protein
MVKENVEQKQDHSSTHTVMDLSLTARASYIYLGLQLENSTFTPAASTKNSVGPSPVV